MSHPTPVNDAATPGLLARLVACVVCCFLATSTICHSQQINVFIFPSPGGFPAPGGFSLGSSDPNSLGTGHYEYNSIATIDEANGTAAIKLFGKTPGGTYTGYDTIQVAIPTGFPFRSVYHRDSLSVSYTFHSIPFTLDIPATHPTSLGGAGGNLYVIPMPSIPQTLTIDYSYTLYEDGNTYATGSGSYDLTGSIKPSVYFDVSRYPSILGLGLTDVSTFQPTIPGNLFQIAGTYGSFSVPRYSVDFLGYTQYSGIPEPSTLGIDASLGLVAWVFIRKHRRARV